MWMVLMLVTMMSITGYYALANETRNLPLASVRGMDLATSMGIYRSAIATYATQYYAIHHANYSGTVAESDLLSLFPPWYRLPAPSIWTNYLASDGTIVIYTLAPPVPNIVPELTSVSGNSAWVGQYNAETNSIESPGFSTATIIPFPFPPDISIPDRSLVWLTHRD